MRFALTFSGATLAFGPQHSSLPLTVGGQAQRGYMLLRGFRPLWRRCSQGASDRESS